MPAKKYNLYIGQKIDEMTIIDINIKEDKYTIECNICHRRRVLKKRVLTNRKTLFHKFCRQDLGKEYNSFYRLWEYLKEKKIFLIFVDFYDKFYQFYLELKQLEEQKIIFHIDEFHVERINDDYFLIPYSNKYSHRRYEGIIYENDKYIEIFRKKWNQMKDRITNKNNHAYKDYGGRNIIIEFESFYQFYKLMYTSYLEAVNKYPNEKISIDRIDVNGNYSVKNCRWLPLSLQNGNRRQNKWIKITSPNKDIFLTKNLFNFSVYMKLHYHTIHENLIHKTKNTQGWKFEYIDIKKYKNLPINEIDVILEITNYPEYKILYKKEV